MNIVNTIGRLILVAGCVGLYVAINFSIASRLVKLNWERFRRIKKYKMRQVSRAFVSTQVVVISGLLVIFLWYVFNELTVSTNIWWSAFVLVFAAILPAWLSCLVLEKIWRIRDLTTSLVNRVGFYILIAFFIWIAKAIVSDELNKIFPIDPALMPIALTAGVFLALSGLIAVPAALIMLVMEVLCFIVIYDRIGRKRNSWKGVAKALLPCAVFIGIAVSVSALGRIGLSDLRNLLIARIAFDYDFHGNHRCYFKNGTDKIALRDNERVLFFGSLQDGGLAAVAPVLPEKPITQITKTETENLYPAKFRFVQCSSD